MSGVHSRRVIVTGGLMAAGTVLLGGSRAFAQKPGEAGPAGPAAATSEIRIAFVGDSLADGLWGGIVRGVQRDRCLRGRVNCGRYARNGTGLTRLDTFSWPSEMRTIVGSFAPHVVVVSLGLNDRQLIVEEDQRRSQWGTAQWDERYMVNVQALARAAMSGGARVVWMGLPALRDRTADEDARVKNVLFETALTQLGEPGARFLAPWRLNQAGEDVFQSYARGATGGMIQIRATDGIHFTSAGYDMIVAYLFPHIVDALTEGGVALPSCNAT